ncbi:MAG: hypothetical protein ACKOTF_01955 [Opitutaceae bacterium]
MSPSSSITRRTAVITLGAGAALTLSGQAQTAAPVAGPLSLTKLPYAYDAL